MSFEGPRPRCDCLIAASGIADHIRPCHGSYNGPLVLTGGCPAMTASSNDSFSAYRELQTPLGTRQIASLEALESESPGLASMPYSIRILLESCLRNCDGGVVTPDDVRKIDGL